MLFADRFPGQNKNSIIATLLLLYISRVDVSIEQISLLYFAAYYGQNERDSTHRAIKTASDNAGDLYVPSQLVPGFRLARRQQPYSVQTPQSTDLIDFKSLSKDIRILSVRSDDQGGTVDWRIMTKIIVKKTETNKIFKTSHLQEEFKSLTLKQQHPQTVTEILLRCILNPPQLS